MPAVARHLKRPVTKRENTQMGIIGYVGLVILIVCIILLLSGRVSANRLADGDRAIVLAGFAGDPKTRSIFDGYDDPPDHIEHVQFMFEDGVIVDVMIIEPEFFKKDQQKPFVPDPGKQTQTNTANASGEDVSWIVDAFSADPDAALFGFDESFTPYTVDDVDWADEMTDPTGTDDDDKKDD